VRGHRSKIIAIVSISGTGIVHIIRIHSSPSSTNMNVSVCGQLSSEKAGFVMCFAPPAAWSLCESLSVNADVPRELPRLLYTLTLHDMTLNILADGDETTNLQIGWSFHIFILRGFLPHFSAWSQSLKHELKGRSVPPSSRTRVHSPKFANMRSYGDKI